jgi:hypothetical protein
MKRNTKFWDEIIEVFEKIAAKEYGKSYLTKDHVDSEGHWLEKTNGYWYTNEKVNTFFKGFLAGISHMEWLRNMEDH